MPQLYIHVGLQKTGSTFLQREVFRKIKDIHLFGEGNRAFSVRNCGSYNKPILISRELFSGSPFNPTGPFDRNKRAHNLHDIFPNAKIIVVFRNKKAWIKSLYSQYVKTGGFAGFNKWYNDLFHKESLDFEGYESLLRSLFDDVLVLWHEDLRKRPDWFVKQICDFMNVDVPDFENRSIGKSLSKNQIKFLRFINRFFRFGSGKDSGIFPAWMSPLYIHRKLIG